MRFVAEHEHGRPRKHSGEHIGAFAIGQVDVYASVPPRIKPHCQVIVPQRNAQDRPHGGLDTLGVEGIHCSRAAQHAPHPEAIGDAQHGTQVAGVVYTVQRDNEFVGPGWFLVGLRRLLNHRYHFVPIVERAQALHFVIGHHVYLQITALGRSGQCACCGSVGEYGLRLEVRGQQFAHHLMPLHQEQTRGLAFLFCMQCAHALQFGLRGQGCGIYLAVAPYCRAGGPKVACTPRVKRAQIAPWVLLILLSIVISGCDPAKRVPLGKHLLTRNTVGVDGDVDKDELQRIVKQKPNKRILGMRFHLGVYNLVDTVKMERGIKEKTAQLEVVNARRKAEDKNAKPYRKTWREWLRETVGEPPVILDTTLTARSTAQMRLYMRKEGYFHATVTDTTLLHRRNGKPFRHRKAKVHYTVVPGKPYTVCESDFVVDDGRMHLYIAEEWDKSLVVPGMRMDADVLDLERKRVTTQLNELGYLYFTRDLLRFDADTAVGILQADMLLRVERPYGHADRSLQGTREGTVHWLEDVVVDMSGRYRQGMPAPDTLRYEGFTFLHRGKPIVRPKSLARHLFLRPTDRYKLSNEDNTYRRLTSLRVFDRVEIHYDTLTAAPPDNVDALLTLLPTRMQGFSVEGAGTNRGGFLGTSISVGYKHRNVARTLGQLSVSVTLGLEAQQSVSGQEANSDGSSTALGEDVLFNTVEIGPEVNYKLPRPILFAGLYGASANARTSFTALYNYQKRPDYTRALGKLSLGQEWYPKPRVLFGVYTDLNLITIPVRTADFQAYLEQANDPVLTDSYTDHLIFTLPRVSRTWNTQGPVQKRSVFFDRTSAELAGTVLRGIDEIVGAPPTEDTSAVHPYFTLFDVRFAEFFKFENDFRYYYTIHDKSSLAFRIAGGFGVPYGNLSVLPFETSFFVGGANGLRAWRARSIGPGAYSKPLDAFDRVGEVRIEGNAEYRFKLVGFLEGALFADVGNIWLLEEDPNKPGSGISNRWLSELAIGTGLGVRFNFDFFIIRFDLGLQTKDPSLPVGERWLFEPKDEYEAIRNEPEGVEPYTYKPKVNFNLGIGYPF